MLSRGSGKCKTDNVESTNVYKSYRIIAEFCMNLTQKLPMPSKAWGAFGLNSTSIGQGISLQYCVSPFNSCRILPQILTGWCEEILF